MRGGRAGRAVHGLILDRRFVFFAAHLLKTLGFFRKLQGSPYPCPGFYLVMGEGIVEEILPQLLRAQSIVDHHQEAVKAHRDRQHFGESRCRIDPVEQGQRQFAVLPRESGLALFTQPDALLTPDRGRHQVICDNPPCDDEGRFPAQVERIAARGAPKCIAALHRHADTAHCIGSYAIIGQMRQASRLPPRTPAIGALFVAQIGSGGEHNIGVVA
jgi:hypothetical protein